jgi:dihydrofolate synthase/folylpolyglutamate synthase
LCSILREAGYRVGLFTSPHLIDFRERIRIASKEGGTAPVEMISEADALRIGERLLATDFGVKPTMFDYCLAMALLYFKEQECDVVILETGLGGRLDSTNAVGTPDVTVITEIGYDHTAILGDTLEQIASEKAGIIKRGTRLVLESMTPQLTAVFEKKAGEVGAANIEIIRREELRETTFDGEMQHFSFGAHEDLTMQMLGVHQYENAAAAILAAEQFFDAAEGTVPEEVIRRGIAAATWAGRMQILSKSPFFLVDGAHNPDGVLALKESLIALYPGEQFHFIMGVMADKNYEEMVEELAPLALDFCTVTVESERALKAQELAASICKKGIPAKPAQLFELVGSHFLWAPADGAKTVAFGSLYFIGEILRKIEL